VLITTVCCIYKTDFLYLSGCFSVFSGTLCVCSPFDVSLQELAIKSLHEGSL